MNEIRATKAEINKLKYSLIAMSVRNFINVFEGYIYSEIIDRMRDAVDLLVARYGEPKQAKKQ